MNPPSAPIGVFCSCAREDEVLLRELKVHLSGLQRQGLISTWYDHQIVPGTDRVQAIDIHLQAASLVLLLVSADFLASNSCYEVEMQQAIQRHETNVARVIPIIVRSCDWTYTPFARLQCLPHDGNPVTEWSNRDSAWSDVVAGIRRAIEGLLLQEIATSVSSDSPVVKISRYLPQSTEFCEQVRMLLALAQYEAVTVALPEGTPAGFYVAEVKAGLNTLRYGIFTYYNEVESCTPEDAQRIADFFLRYMGTLDLARGELVTKHEVSSQVKAIIGPYITAKTEESIWKGLINFNKYLRKLVEMYERVSDGSKDVPLAKVYIDLDAEYRQYEGESRQVSTLRSTSAEYNTPWQGNIEDVIRRWLASPDPAQSSLALLADYGSGKTTFCQHMAAILAQEYLAAGENRNTQHRIPLWIPLLDFAKAPFDLHSFLTAHLKRRCKVDNPDSESLLKMAEAGLIFFMFDGFDEMASRANKDTVRQNIMLFRQLTELSHNKVLLTTRLEYFMTLSEELHILGSFPRLYLRPLNDQQIDLYLQKRVPFIKKQRGTVTQDWHYYRDMIRNIHDLSDLARRPVLLEMIVKTLPKLIAEGKAVNRPNLYYRYLQGELERQLAKQRRDLLIDGQKRFEIMECIALELHQLGKAELAGDKIREISKGILTAEQRIELEGSLREILTCSFLIRTGDVYRFSHQSFQEYLVARCLARDIKHNRRETFRQKLISPAIQGFLLELEMRAMQERADDSSIISLADPNVSFDYKTLVQWHRDNPKNRWVSNNAISLLAGLSRAKLRGIDLSGADLSEAELMRADLSGADLGGVILMRADLSGANLNGAKLMNADLTEADLRGAKLQGINLSGADLSGAKLQGINLSGVDLSGAKLRGIDLSGANLNGARLMRADLSGADLSGAILMNADLTEVSLKLAKLVRADLTGTRLIGAKLRGAYLKDANLLGVDFTGASLFGADLRDTNLRDTNLRNADLRNADLEGAHNLEFIKSLENVDIYFVKGLTPEQYKTSQERRGTRDPAVLSGKRPIIKYTEE